MQDYLGPFTLVSSLCERCRGPWAMTGKNCVSPVQMSENSQ